MAAKIAVYVSTDGSRADRVVMVAINRSPSEQMAVISGQRLSGAAHLFQMTAATAAKQKIRATRGGRRSAGLRVLDHIGPPSAQRNHGRYLLASLERPGRFRHLLFVGSNHDANSNCVLTEMTANESRTPRGYIGVRFYLQPTLRLVIDRQGRLPPEYRFDRSPLDCCPGRGKNP